MASELPLFQHTSELDLTNGLTQHTPDINMDSSIQSQASDSPYSEPANPPHDPINLDGANSDANGSEDELLNGIAASEVDDDDEDDAAGEKDEEYNEDVAVSEPDLDASGSSLSTGSSPRPSKRKATAEDDDYMLQNPELYGLRRSGRARPSRALAESDEDDEDDVISARRNKRSKVTKSRPSTLRNTNSHSDQTPLEDSDEDADFYGGARSRALAKKTRRRLNNTSGGSTPQNGAIRFSDRRGAKVTTYNEEESDEEEYIATADTNVVQDTGPAIDEVLNHRLVESTTSSDPGKKDFEYLIKWQGEAHYHATWSDWAGLAGYRGIRRVENYFRKIVEHDLYIMHEPGVAPEEREQWLLDRETKADELTERQKVERVIDQRRTATGTEYFVKWKALSYEHCTWENEALVKELAPKEIEHFLDRSSYLPTNDKREANPATRRAYQRFKDQPSYVKFGELRNFQLHGINFLAHAWCSNMNVILADEMGLGKTVQTVSFLDWLKNDRGQEGPFLVVVPLSTIPAWAETFTNWTPDLNYVVYSGNEASRAIIRDQELLVNGNPKKVKFNVLLTTYEFVNTDSNFLSQIKWYMLAVDEAHRLKNRESQLYTKLASFSTANRLLITGTPLQNKLSELSALMNFLHPGMVEVDDNLDIVDENSSHEISKLMDTIRPYVLRRTKNTVESDLPPKTEKIIRVELADVQLELYKNVLTRNYTALNAGAKAPKTSLLNIMMELKKASNHAFMFPAVEERILPENASREEQLKAIVTSSGKMMLLDQLLIKLKEGGHRVLIFSQMVKLLDILNDYFGLRGYQCQRLDGTIPAGARKLAIDHFNAPDSQDFAFLLSTRAGGLGINLMTADTVILFDSDWNPQADLQAMARAHRIGQKNPVTIYRFVSKDTIEEEVLERARNKLMLEFITIQRGITDKDASNALRDQLTDRGKSAMEPTTSADISNILKKRGQKMFEQSGNQKKLEELDIDAVLENAELHNTEQPEGITTDGGEDFLKSFNYTDVKVDANWDDIIPAAEMAKIRAQEREAADEEYHQNLKPLEPRKRKAPDDSREGRAAKKRARELVEEAADDSDDENLGDPARPLNEKECRNLVKAHERYGSIDEKETEIIRDARLLNRDAAVVKSTMKSILDQAQSLVTEEQARLDEIINTEQRAITKKDKKTLLFDFNGVKRLNAETLTERPVDMHLLRQYVGQVDDWHDFRLTEADKTPSYSTDWGLLEDGMLCVGMSRHGYGAWAVIRDDIELGLKDKLFLEEHRVDNKAQRDKDKTEKEDAGKAKSPGAVHLVRRAAYLFGVMREKNQATTEPAKKTAASKVKAGEKQGRTPTPIPAVRKSTNGADRRKLGSPNGITKRNASAGIKRRISDENQNGFHRADSSSKEKGKSDDKKIAMLLAPIKSFLQLLKTATKKHVPDAAQRLTIIKENLKKTGQHIKKVMSDVDNVQEIDVWDYVAQHHWAQSSKQENHVVGEKLSSMYQNLSKSTTSKDALAKDDSAKDAIVKDVASAENTAPVTKPVLTYKKAKASDLPSFKRRSTPLTSSDGRRGDGTDRRDQRRDGDRPSSSLSNESGANRPYSRREERRDDRHRSRSASPRADYNRSQDRKEYRRDDHRGDRWDDRRENRRDDRRDYHENRRDDRRGFDRVDSYRPGDRRDDRFSDRRDPPRYNDNRDHRRDDRRPSPRPYNNHRDVPRSYDRPPSRGNNNGRPQDPSRSSLDRRDLPRFDSRPEHPRPPRPEMAIPGMNGQKPQESRTEHPLPPKPAFTSNKRSSTDANGLGDDRGDLKRHRGSFNGDSHRSDYHDRPPSRDHYSRR